MHRVGVAPDGRRRRRPGRRGPPRAAAGVGVDPPRGGRRARPTRSRTSSSPASPRPAPTSRRPASTSPGGTPPTRPVPSPTPRPGSTWCGSASPSTGSTPRPALAGAVDLRPALRLVSRVSHVKEIAAGAAVSYGQRYRVDAPTTIATVPVGYADGLRRSLGAVGGEVLVGGRRRPIAGTVTMDQITVDCGPGAAGRPRRRGGPARPPGRRGDPGLGVGRPASTPSTTRSRAASGPGCPGSTCGAGPGCQDDAMSSAARRLVLAGGAVATVVVAERVAARRLRRRVDPTADARLRPPTDVRHLEVATLRRRVAPRARAGRGPARRPAPRHHPQRRAVVAAAARPGRRPPGPGRRPRGHGRSVAGSAGYGMGPLGVRRRRPCSRASTCATPSWSGHSMGGMATLNFAVDHPDVLRERVGGIGLVATAAGDLLPSRCSGPGWPPSAALIVERLDDGRSVPSYRFTGNDLSLFLCRLVFGQGPLGRGHRAGAGVDRGHRRGGPAPLAGRDLAARHHRPARPGRRPGLRRGRAAATS